MEMEKLFEEFENRIEQRMQTDIKIIELVADIVRNKDIIMKMVIPIFNRIETILSTEKFVVDLDAEFIHEASKRKTYELLEYCILEQLNKIIDSIE